jgi:hypothetical protein
MLEECEHRILSKFEEILTYHVPIQLLSFDREVQDFSQEERHLEIRGHASDSWETNQCTVEMMFVRTRTYLRVTVTTSFSSAMRAPLYAGSRCYR